MFEKRRKFLTCLSDPIWQLVSIRSDDGYEPIPDNSLIDENVLKPFLTGTLRVGGLSRPSWVQENAAPCWPGDIDGHDLRTPIPQQRKLDIASS
jgi:hypothetical protein